MNDGFVDVSDPIVGKTLSTCQSQRVFTLILPTLHVSSWVCHFWVDTLFVSGRVKQSDVLWLVSVVDYVYDVVCYVDVSCVFFFCLPSFGQNIVLRTLRAERYVWNPCRSRVCWTLGTVYNRQCLYLGLVCLVCSPLSELSFGGKVRSFFFFFNLERVPEKKKKWKISK